MCKVKTPEITPAAPAPAPPPVLQQIAPKSSANSDSKLKKKRTGLSKYSTQSTGSPSAATALGGIPSKVGV